MTTLSAEPPAAIDTPLAATNLSKSYGSQPVLRDCTLAVPAGSIVGLLGENGAGKTTLLQLLVGMLRPSSGTATILGQPAATLSEDGRSRIGYVPQRHEMPAWLTVRQTLDAFAAFYPGACDPDPLLARWRIPESKKVAALSGGQQQLVSIILAMQHSPDVLVLDEPVASLDPRMRRDFLDLLHERSELAREDGRTLTILFSTHLLSDLERTATHVALMRDGQIAVMQPLDELQAGTLRLRITGRDPLPPPLLPAITLTQSMRTVVATIRVADEPRWTEWAERQDAAVRPERLSLEDLFVELTGDGPPPPTEESIRVADAPEVPQ